MVSKIPVEYLKLMFYIAAGGKEGGLTADGPRGRGGAAARRISWNQSRLDPARAEGRGPQKGLSFHFPNRQRYGIL